MQGGTRPVHLAREGLDRCIMAIAELDRCIWPGRS